MKWLRKSSKKAPGGGVKGNRPGSYSRFSERRVSVFLSSGEARTESKKSGPLVVELGRRGSLRLRKALNLSGLHDEIDEILRRLRQEAPFSEDDPGLGLPEVLRYVGDEERLTVLR